MIIFDYKFSCIERIIQNEIVINIITHNFDETGSGCHTLWRIGNRV